MKQVLIKKGQPTVEDVPAPCLEKETVLVKLENSCISVGTEMGGIKASRIPLWRKALSQPEKLIMLKKMVADQGLGRTQQILRQKRDNLTPLGYSAAGIVIAAGEEVNAITAGTRVACAGAQAAYHAEFVRVPKNLVVPIPDNLDSLSASTVALGAIALQGVRRASPSIGETVVVAGLGIIGQLTAQILKASGCHVIGMDMDPGRLAVAKRLGIEFSTHGSDGNVIDTVFRLTGGYGADAVVVTAATPSHELISTAFRMCRKKAKVVLVGDVGLNLNRQDIYQKELDFLVSTSYGPGRYDEQYEEHGVDYPIGYVRWTENRNMAEYLRMLASGQVRVHELFTRVFNIEDAPEAYAYLEGSKPRPLLVMLAYPKDPAAAEPVRRIEARTTGTPKNGRLGISIVGAGSFAKSMHLPNLVSLRDLYSLRGIMSRTGHNAASIAGQFGANYSTTEFGEILADRETDVILVATRHDLHASMALKALKAGKHVLVEKPLALDRAGLDAFKVYLEQTGVNGAPILMTGFNRRFSPYMVGLKEALRNRTNPLIMNYRMNAGFIPADNWVHGPEGGGRNLGEACHIYDLFTFLTESKIEDIQAVAIRPKTDYYRRNDNFTATLRFSDGSIASLTYTAMGTKEFPKEEMEVYCDGSVISMKDYRTMAFFGMKRKKIETKIPEKGQLEELKLFAEAVKAGGNWPIPFWQQEQASEIAFQIEEKLRRT
jgi:predicted dehydrogenase